MTKRKMDWDRRIGRQLRLRDLHVLQAVAQHGSMAKAAAHLSVTQPAISQSIGDLEAIVGVKLLDRGPRGVVPTLYGEALMRRSLEALDALSKACVTSNSSPIPEAERSASELTCPILPAASWRQSSS